jgi:hypothetical protein
MPVMHHYDGVSWSPVSAPVIQAIDQSTFPGVISTADAAGNVWFSLSLMVNATPPNGEWRWRDDLFAYSHGTWTQESLPIADGEVTQLTTDGNGGAWAIVTARNPLGTAILYTPGTTWSVYGQS